MSFLTWKLQPWIPHAQDPIHPKEPGRVRKGYENGIFISKALYSGFGEKVHKWTSLWRKIKQEKSPSQIPKKRLASAMGGHVKWDLVKNADMKPFTPKSFLPNKFVFAPVHEHLRLLFLVVLLGLGPAKKPAEGRRHTKRLSSLKNWPSVQKTCVSQCVLCDL